MRLTGRGRFITMSDRYQNRQFSADQYDRGGDASARADGDPLAELARLIGQTDPFGQGRTPAPHNTAQRLPTPQPIEDEEEYDTPAPPPGPPSWMQRANRREVPRSEQRDFPPLAPPVVQTRDVYAEAPRAPQQELRREPQWEPPRGYPGGTAGYQQAHDVAPQQDFAEPEFDHRYDHQQPAPQPRAEAARPVYSEPAPHNQAYTPSFGEQEFANEFAKFDFSAPPAHRPAAPPVQAEPDYHQQPAYDEPEPDPSRYDEALYGQIAPAPQYQNEQGFQGEEFSYDNYDEVEEEAPKKRHGGLVVVAGILALAFVGTGAAYGYKTFFLHSHSGPPPIIKADTSPTKIMATPSDSASKMPDRLLGGDGTEKMVSREETPVDVTTRSVGGPRVVLPPLSQNGNPPTVASVSVGTMPVVTASTNNGTMPNSDPRPIRTVSIGGDQAGGAPSTAARPLATSRATPPTGTVTAPVAAPRPSPVNANASVNAPLSLAPQVAAPAGRVAALAPAEPAATASGSNLVSVLSQDSEANALAAYKVVQGKYPSFLGSRSPVITRKVDKDGKTHYRAAVGPFATFDEARQMCASYAASGGQCFPFKN